MFVVDASALMKLVFDEPGHVEFRAWYLENSGADLIAPFLIFSETGRTLQKRLAAAPPALKEIHAQLLANIDLIASLDHETWGVIAGLTFYDAEYIRLAQRTNSVLVTADEKMATAARRVGIELVQFPGGR